MFTKKQTIFFITVVSVIVGVIVFSKTVYLFGIAAIIAYMLYPLMTLIENKAKVKKGFSIPITLILVVVVLTLIVSLFTPILTKQVNSFINLLPVYSERFLEYISSLDEVLASFGIDGGLLSNIQTLIKENYQTLVKALGSIAGNVFVKLSVIPGILFDASFIFMFVIYFLIDGDRMIASFRSLFTDKNTNRIVSTVLEKSHTMVWNYLKMKTLLAGMMAVVMWIGFMIIGLENAFLFAFIAFLFDFIPYVGAYVAAAFPAIIALIDGGFTKLIIVLVFIIIVQQVQGSIVAPKFQADSVGIHPLVGLFALLACSQLWGGIGMFISVPVAGFVQILCLEVRSYYLTLK